MMTSLEEVLGKLSTLEADMKGVQVERYSFLDHLERGGKA